MSHDGNAGCCLAENPRVKPGAIFKGTNIGRIFKVDLGIQAITHPINRKNCYSRVYNPAGAEEAEDALADALNTINRANFKGLATADQWTVLVNESLVYAEDEEGHEEEEHGGTEHPEPEEPEEEPQDPVEDEDEPLIITHPLEKILQEEWGKCKHFL